MVSPTSIQTTSISLPRVQQLAKEVQDVEFRSTYSFFVFPEKMLTVLKHNGRT